MPTDDGNVTTTTPQFGFIYICNENCQESNGSPVDSRWLRDDIGSQSLIYTLPANPEIGVSPSCTRLGTVGAGLTGGVIYNALDAFGDDPGAHEIQDTCEGHPQAAGVYHNHNRSPCPGGQS